ncbi:hypothetical protein HDU76_009550, partial [Blyttiomyces sp. JEL0837]
MSGNSLRRLVFNVQTNRAQRFNKVLNLHATLITENKEQGNFLDDDQQTIPSMNSGQYMTLHKPPSRHMLTNCWLKQTEAWVMAAKVLRRSIEVKKAIQMDGTYKYAKKVKVNIDGANHSADETTVLYIAINEIGQVIDWSWMKAESHDQIRPFLQNIVRNHVGTQDQPFLLTSTSSSSNMISGQHDIVEYDDDREDFDEDEDGNQDSREEATEIE